MALEYVGTFVLTDESLDRHSERVIVKGIDLAPFNKNPIMFFNHIRAMSGWWSSEAVTDDAVLPIGRWENIKKIDNDRIEADAFVDMDDEFAAKIGNKVKSGIINAVSIGFNGKAYSDAEEDKVLGQRGLTITKCELVEASLVDIPANPNAVVVAKMAHEKSAASEGREAGEIFFVKTFHKKEESMDSNNFFDSVKAFVKKTFGKDVTTEAEALTVLQEGAELPNVSLDAVKADMQTEMQKAIKMAVDEVRSEYKTAVKDLALQVAKMATAMEEMSNQPDQVEEKAEEIDELKAEMDALSARVAGLQAKKSGISPKHDAPPVKEGETLKEKEQREELSIRNMVTTSKNGNLASKN